MPPHQRCIHCGRPWAGRFCYDCLGTALDASRQLWQTNPAAWKAAVDHANAEPAETPANSLTLGSEGRILRP